MTKPVWHKGPPPSLGWWPASTNMNPGVIRWWDGAQWSVAVGEGSTRPGELAACATFCKNIYWTRRPASWPARSKT